MIKKVIDLEKIDVRGLTTSYQILIEKGLLKKAGQLIGEVIKPKKIIVISDENVRGLYFQTLRASLEESGFEVIEHVIEPGEKSKTLSNMEKICEKMAQENMSRSDAVVALGGGVVGDLSGFVASSYMRGVDFIQIPTTLLSQVDSSVGGKVAVNLKNGKNLVGAFYNPKRVIIDPDCLKTLEEKYVKDGIAEVIKYGCIWDKELFSFLKEGSAPSYVVENSTRIIKRCCEIKRDVVQEDELDRGLRMLLNFGHTLGHGIEAYYDYKRYTHGYAVAIGMVLVSSYSESIGLTKEGTTDEIRGLLESYGLPSKLEGAQVKDIIDYTKRDKKVSNGKLNLIIIEEIGKARIHRMDLCDIDDIAKRRA